MATNTVIGPEPADCPEDGGKWALYCEHQDASGEILYTAVLQDSNKRRLSEWKRHSADWCSACRDLREEQEEAQR